MLENQIKTEQKHLKQILNDIEKRKSVINDKDYVRPSLFTNNQIFDFENSLTIHVSSEDYLINGDKYYLEYSIYHSENEKDTPFLFLEEAFDKNDKKIEFPYFFTKTKAKAFDIMRKRKNKLRKVSTKA